MARLEVAVNSPLAFSASFNQHRGPGAIGELVTRGPDTVGIDFRGRLFVWHAFPSRERPGPGNEEWGPSVTVLVEDEADVRRAADDLQRFVSALSFHYQEPAETLPALVTDVTDPYHPAEKRAPRTRRWGFTLTEPPTRITLRHDRNVQLAVGYFREGLNAGSPFYGFLAFWNALDATFGIERDASRREAFITSLAPRARALWDDAIVRFPPDLAAALQDDSRNAIAHVLRDVGKRSIDPDAAPDRARLRMEADVLKWMAHAAVEQEYPDGVEAHHRRAA